MSPDVEKHMETTPRPHERDGMAGPAEPLSARCAGKNKCREPGQPPARPRRPAGANGEGWGGRGRQA